MLESPLRAVSLSDTGTDPGLQYYHRDIKAEANDVPKLGK